MSSPSIWELQSFYAHQDIIIVGGGLAGLWSAWHLAKNYPAKKIMVVDKELIPSGASTRNAGFACFGSVTELLDDKKIMGEEKMLELVAMRYEGLQLMTSITGSQDIDFEMRGGYELITNQQYPDDHLLNQDIEELNLTLNTLIKENKIFSRADPKIRQFGFQQTTHLIENKLEGQLHSGKLVKWLLQRIQFLGVSVLHGIEVSRFEKDTCKINVHTNLSVAFSTDKLLVCTNSVADRLLPGMGIIPARGQVFLTDPIPNLPFKGTFHYDEGYYYFRDLGNRILLGGARNKAFGEEETTEPVVTEMIQQELERFLKEVVLPGQAVDISHRWSGIMGMGKEKIPTVKEVQPNIYCAVGLGGMGVALAPLIGRKAAEMLGG